MPLTPGTRLGPYEILAPLGPGGMGEVYKADTRRARIVALKVSKTEFSERLEREARAIAPLNHPHICQLYDCRVIADTALRGKMTKSSLRELMRKTGLSQKALYAILCGQPGRQRTVAILDAWGF